MSFLKKATLGTLLLALVLGSFGCGIPKADYEALKQENTQLTDAKQQLESTVTKAQADLASVTKDLGKSNSDLASLQADYDDAVAEKEVVAKELEEIKAVYPPREFTSVTELRNWLLQNDISERPVTATAELWYSVAIELQKAALNDGYIVSIDYDTNEARDTWRIYCNTVINGDIWYWDPEEDDIYMEQDLGPVE